MKRIAIFLFLLMFAVPAMSATAVVRQGNALDQYKISDPGGDYDNYLVIIAFEVTEVLIQTSSIDLNTQKESLLCWDDSEILECPDDDIGGGVFRMPILVFLNEIFESNGVTTGADLTDLQEKSLYLGFWHEYRTEKVIEDSITEMELEGLNAVQTRRALKYVYFGLGIDLTTAQSLANNRINNTVQATYDEYGLATVPLQDRRLLDLFGSARWFD